MLKSQSPSLMFDSNSITITKSPISLKYLTSPQKRYKVEAAKYTIDAAINAIGIGLYQIPIFIIIGMSFWGFAAEIMMLSFLLPITENEWNLNNNIQSIIAGVVFMGIILSAPFWSYIGNKYGRKAVIVFCSLGQNIVGISTAFSVNIYWMISLKFFVGLFLGASVIYFKVITEYLPKSFRGKLLLFQMFCWSIGSTLNALLAFISMEWLNWRLYIILSYSISLCIISFCLCFMDKSPIYLLSKGDVDAAQNILIKAAKRNRKQLPKGTLKEYPIKHIEYLSDWDSIFHPEYGAIYVTSITLYVISFLCGFCYYGICFFSVKLLQKYSINVFGKQILIASGEFICIFTWLSLDNCARKFAFIVHFGFYLYSMCALMLSSIQNSVNWVIIFLFIGRMGIFSSLLVLNVYMNEYYKNNIRDTAIMIEIVIAAIGGIITSFVSQTDNIQWALYIYVIMGVVLIIAAFRLTQDTKNDIVPNRMPLIIHTPRSVSSKQVFNKHRGVFEWQRIETKEEPKYVFLLE